MEMKTSPSWTHIISILQIDEKRSIIKNVVGSVAQKAAKRCECRVHSPICTVPRFSCEQRPPSKPTDDLLKCFDFVALGFSWNMTESSYSSYLAERGRERETQFLSWMNVDGMLHEVITTHRCDPNRFARTPWPTWRLQSSFYCCCHCWEAKKPETGCCLSARWRYPRRRSRQPGNSVLWKLRKQSHKSYRRDQRCCLSCTWKRDEKLRFVASFSGDQLTSVEWMHWHEYT